MPEDSPNLDLIRMVQQARMAHDAQAKPSQVNAVYWIEAKPLAEDAPAPTPRAGEFLIETNVEAIDALWDKIREATQRGVLGYKSKAATVSRTDDPRARLIVVRTVDADDEHDRARVRDALADIGIIPARYVRINTPD